MTMCMGGNAYMCLDKIIDNNSLFIFSYKLTSCVVFCRYFLLTFLVLAAFIILFYFIYIVNMT